MTAPADQSRRAGSWLAMLAVVLLTWAGVRSTVMQVQMAATGAASCADMPGMTGRAGKSVPAKPARCEDRAAAAHPPVQASAPRLAPPSSVVVFARYDAPAARGPRGPPSRRATARGPPPTLSV